jgi:hypothetical protein
MTGIYLCGTLGTVQKTQIMIGFKLLRSLSYELKEKHLNASLLKNIVKQTIYMCLDEMVS